MYVNLGFTNDHTCIKQFLKYVWEKFFLSEGGR